MDQNPGDELARVFGRMASALGGEARTLSLQKMGDAAAKLFDDEVTAELGDSSMSRWTGATKKNGTRAPAVPIVSTWSPQGSTGARIGPRRQAVGAMSTLSYGRSAYQAGDRRVKGTYVSKRTGERTARTRLVKGTVGAAAGKGVWQRAAVKVERDAPDIAERVVFEALREVLGG